MFETLRFRTQKIVSEGISSYTTEYKINIIEKKQVEVLSLFIKLLLEIYSRIELNEKISIFPLKPLLTELVFILDFNKDLLSGIVVNIFSKLYAEIESISVDNLELIRVLAEYERLILELVVEPKLLGVSSAQELLQQIPEYQYSNEVVQIYRRDIADNRRLYTMFPKERYWENYSTQATTIKSSDIVIYKQKLYRVKPSIPNPSISPFVQDEWDEVKSKKFDKTKSFNLVLSKKVDYLYQEFLKNSFDINGIISDSSVKTYSSTQKVVEEELVNTFAGEGRKVYALTRELGSISEAFGGYDGSVTGGIEYTSKYMEYLLLCSFGRKSESLSNSSSLIYTELFGQFDKIFLSKKTEDIIPGLSFLNPFNGLRSFLQNQKVPEDAYLQEKDTLRFNPISSKYANGVKDFYTSEVLLNTYSESPRVDLVLYTLENVYRNMLQVGDSVKAVIDSLDKSGRASGFEGLGSIEIQMRHLQSIFPPVYYFSQSPENRTVGLTSAIKILLDSYGKISQVLVYPQLPGDALETLLEWVYLVRSKIEQLISTFKTIGISTKSFIPDISYKNYQTQNSSLVEFLKTLGFRDSEINTLLNVQSFTELIENFAPLSNSDDLKSFFKGYELSQLIYEFSGDRGISAYLSFLYSNESIDSLLNILSLTLNSPSKVTSLQVSKYPRLIGLLIGLTYAIDPTQIVKFNNILQGNNLTLLQSIQALYQSGQKNIIKSEKEIDLLGPVIDQIVQGFYDNKSLSQSLNYEQVNSSAPIALKQWTKIISENLGKTESSLSIHQLYDKSLGLTPRELISVLNKPNSLSSFSELIDEFDGGDFTRFIKYANLSGLSTKLSYYKNSAQINNFKVDLEETKNFNLVSLVNALDSTLESMELMTTILENSLVFRPVQSNISSNFVDSVVFAQNKVYDSFLKIFNKISSSPLNIASSLSDTLQEIREAPILESPGIGNSRLPNRIPALNTISPEQNAILLSQKTSSVPTTTTQEIFQESNLISKFIKFSNQNSLANGIVLVDEQLKPSQQNLVRDPISEFETLDKVPVPSSKPYQPLEIYNSLPIDSEVKTQSLGINYLSKSNKYQTPGVNKFDPVESCKKFGGQNCDEIYQNLPKRCPTGFNKSLFPEDYFSIPGSKPHSVYVDRPLGTFAKYKSSTNFAPNSAFASPPSFFSLLPEDAVPSSKGEPIFTDQKVKKPLIFKKGNGATSEYGNTEFAMVDFIRTKLEKNSEFECASFDSPFQYQICMNIMKCKRFTSQSTGQNWLDFCPKTLAGGVFKP